MKIILIFCTICLLTFSFLFLRNKSILASNYTEENFDNGEVAGVFDQTQESNLTERTNTRELALILCLLFTIGIFFGAYRKALALQKANSR